MDTITSLTNQRVKNWKKLLSKNGRKKAQQYIIEGYHLIEEALASDVDIDELISNNERDLDEIAVSAEVKKILITDEIMKEISDTESSQGVFATVAIPEEGGELSYEIPLLLLESVQDPGNVGTLIRTADAAGFEGVILGKGTVDAYNPKALRSAQGSHFHINIIEGDLDYWLEELKEQDVPVYGTALTGESVSYREIDSDLTFALMVGNEGNGISNHFLNKTKQNLHIPMKGQAESLNVAIAAGILMFSLHK